MTASIMVQGAGSNVGKSVLVAGLCRYFASKGLKVMPFKPQNMSNNAAVTIDNGEIGRAQALQARAARTAAISDMNPVLLKPETDTGAQIIVQGTRYGTMRAAEYGKHKASLMPTVMESYTRLKAMADLVIIEGAGSPAEVNLRKGDIANMGFAEEADVPVILVGDIDRGGVIASLVGTHAVLETSEKQRIKGFLINKFRGDTQLFADGMNMISDRTGWQGLGILPWFGAAARLPAEDILDLENKASQSSMDNSCHVAVPVIRRIANFDDLDPLSQDPSFRVTLVKPGEPIPLDADLVLLPGSKSTIADLQFLREQGWDQDLMTLRRHGKAVIGLCGGYQMLGKYIHDPHGIEGIAGRVDGLGLLDIETTLTEQKTLTQTTGIESQTWAAVSGYEIHLGQTTGPDTAKPMLHHIEGRDGITEDGAVSPDGQVAGCYMHGLFASDTFRSAWLNNHGRPASEMIFESQIDTTLDQLADHLASHADLDAIAKIAGLS